MDLDLESCLFSNGNLAISLSRADSGTYSRGKEKIMGKRCIRELLENSICFSDCDQARLSFDANDFAIIIIYDNYRE